MRQLEKEWLLLAEQQESCNNFAVRRTIEATRAAYQADPTPAAFEKLQKMTRSTDELEKRNREVRRQVETAIGEFAVKRVAPVVEPVLRKAAKKVAEFAVSVRRQEEEVANQIGIAYVASNSVHALDALVRSLNAKADGLAAKQYRGEASPKSFLRNVVEL
ncbi:MAG: hypothetical protein HY674_06690 [Chloroflexi bacterium]|nr:hypothetical protein [Chloroflexota bacterium]